MGIVNKTLYVVYTAVNRLYIRIKKFYYTEKTKRSCGAYITPLKVNGKTTVSRNTFLGKNVNFNGMEIKGRGKVIFGANFHSGPGCKIITQNHNFNGKALPYDSTVIIKETRIGNQVWFGDDVTILAGVTIGDGAIIQAGSVVVSNIPEMGIAGGHPAKVFKYRDQEHYDNLLKECKFQ